MTLLYILTAMLTKFAKGSSLANIRMIRYKDKDAPASQDEDNITSLTHLEELSLTSIQLQSQSLSEDQCHQQDLSTNNASETSMGSWSKQACGYLTQINDSLFDREEELYCVLTRDSLSCYENETKAVRKSYFWLQYYSIKLIPSKEGFTLDFAGEHSQLAFKTRQHEQKMWISCFQFALEGRNNDGLKFKPLCKHLFFSKDFVYQPQFPALIQSGDILLSKSSQSLPTMQRLITNSDYDHVAVFVKFLNNDVKILQANEDEGVQLYDWNQYFRQFSTRKVAFRKLVIPHPQDTHDKITVFIRELCGEKYELNLLKMLGGRRKKSSRQIAEDKSKGYFCSELAAKLYKYLGLLDEVVSSSSYWPIDFTEKSGIQLKKGAYLEPERLLVLKSHLRQSQ